MKKILIGIKNNALTFSYKKNSKISNDLLNTKLITDNELIFSDEYIEENIKIVTGFIKELILEYKISQLIIKESSLAILAFNLIKEDEHIKAVFFREEKQLSYEICERVLKCKNIKIINCYNMPPYMLECFDKKGIKTESRSEIMFSSSFMQGNNLMQYSKIFYKLSVRMEFPLKEQDIQDFKVFCKINTYLKTIHINAYDKNSLQEIINILKEEKIKNVKIYIHDNNLEDKELLYLKKMNSHLKKQKIKIGLKYSDDYLKNNIFKQIVVNVLKVCGLLTLFLVVSFMSYVGISNYKASKEVNKIKENINNVIDNTNQEEVIEDLNKDIEKEEDKVTNGYVASLLQLNSETVGWLTVNNTNIDYPVVQGDDNQYYLTHNFNYDEDNNGWVYMDFRNDNKDLSKNTIIYAHNRYYSGVMFGTLHKVAYKSWYGKEENLNIRFDTLYGEKTWRVFSIYKIPVTSDYLQIKFNSDDEWMEFVNMIKDRSIKKFDTPVGVNDKILTLSTCSSTRDTRLVVHAVLVN